MRKVLVVSAIGLMLTMGKTYAWIEDPSGVPLAQTVFDGTQATTQLSYHDIQVAIDTVPEDDDHTGCSPPPNRADCRAIIAIGRYAGQQAFTLREDQVRFLNGKPELPVTVEVRRLDPTTMAPQVLLTVGRGDETCCTWRQVATVDSSGVWHLVNTEVGWDEVYQFSDLDGNGGNEMIAADQRLPNSFGSYAGSAPTRILKLVGVEIKDVTKDPRYRGFLRQNLKEMERDWRDFGDPITQINGYLAGWVAQKILIGELDDAWRGMLKSRDMLDRRSYHYVKCGDCEFPEALATVLVDSGYLTAGQSSRLVLHPPTPWYIYNGETYRCMPAVEMASAYGMPGSETPEGYDLTHRQIPGYQGMHILRDSEGSIRMVGFAISHDNNSELDMFYFPGRLRCEVFAKSRQNSGVAPKPGELK